MTQHSPGWRRKQCGIHHSAASVTDLKSQASATCIQFILCHKNWDTAKQLLISRLSVILKLKRFYGRSQWQLPNAQHGVEARNFCKSSIFQTPFQSL